MPASVNIVSTLNGLYKEVYPDGISNAVPNIAELSKIVKFTEKEKVGNLYHQPVILSQEHGATYLAAGAGASALNGAISAIMIDAQIQGTQLILRSQMDYEAAAKAAGGGKRSFMDATEVMIKNLMEASYTRKEIMSFYGTSGLGIISSVSAVSTAATITLTTASYAVGIWNGAINCPIDAYRSTVKVNTNAVMYVTSVDPVNHTISVSGNATDLGNLAGADVLYFYGAYGKEFIGLDKILTTSGSLFNITNSTYHLFAGNSQAVGGSLTLAKIQSAIALAVGKGLNEEVNCYVNPLTFANLITNEAALRKYDSSYSGAKVENGAEAIKFHSMNGIVNVKPHIVIKEGEGFIFPVKRLSYIGATDVTMTIPGTNNEQVFLHIPDYNTYEMRSYMNLALFTDKVGWGVKLTGIVNA